MLKAEKEKKGDNEMTEGIQYLDFETFTKTELKVGKILSVDNHENADKLYVVKLDDGTDNGRTICAGLKEYYSPEDMIGNMWCSLQSQTKKVTWCDE